MGNRVISTTSKALLLAVMLALTSSCSYFPFHEDKQAAKTERTVIRFWDENAGPSRTPYYLELFRRFEELHPNLKVEYSGIPVSFNKLKFDMAILSGDTPDVASMNAEWLAGFAAKGVLLPLDGYYAQWPEREQIADRFISFNRGLAPDGRLYQIPGTFFFDVLWYRSDLLKKEGLAAPQSWDGFFQAVDRLDKPDQGRRGYSLRGGAGSITQLTSLLYAYSGITEYFTKDGRCTINDPRHLEFLQRYTALYGSRTKTSDILNGYKEMVAAFDSGASAMFTHNFGSYRDHLSALGAANVGAALLPRSVTGNRVMTLTANGYGIFRSTANPDAAWELVKFLLSEESQTYWNRNVGQLPTNQQALLQNFIQDTPFLKEALLAMEDNRTVMLRVPYNLPNYTDIIQQRLEPNFQKVLSGSMTDEDFLNDWAQVMEQAYSHYRQ
ncbi:ABC transporter substrate-binding protein [Paenibacillus sp. HW567]|uniref:ABC transporter substrate-binding protein n=1 Tax=Paenibacillus sp. HW567 TaxID=1034769 RepID=UPI00036D27F2|nr:sugar ABC transporter substrate-binding protein [Paenibacillus sp. HW567]